VDQVYAPEKLIKIDGGSRMRRKIEFFTGKKQTSFFLLDSFFSSLPPLAAKCMIATDLHKTKKINYKEKNHVSTTRQCLILDSKSSGTRSNGRKVYGLNGTINFKTASGNGNGKRFIHYKNKKINGTYLLSIS
jgi:hypothetical protein